MDLINKYGLTRVKYSLNLLIPNLLVILNKHGWSLGGIPKSFPHSVHYNCDCDACCCYTSQILAEMLPLKPDTVLCPYVNSLSVILKTEPAQLCGVDGCRTDLTAQDFY